MFPKDIEEYFNKTEALAKTIVVKSPETADGLNLKLKMNYGASAVDDDNPYSWKYYLNIAGIRHPLDPVIQVTSLDTGDLIDFATSELAVHKATQKAYQYGSVYYEALRQRFPEEELYLLGVLYPANIETAILAEDGAILSYPKGLVESQEISLIQELQDWSKGIQRRWKINAFGLGHSLFFVTQHAIFYHQLFSKLLNLRQKRCHTAEAHSFHVKQYLASHGKLDRFIPYLTKRQQFFLYRNIDYIEHHPGNQDTFMWLIENILTPRKIPLATYIQMQSGQPTEGSLPNFHFTKKPLNPEITGSEIGTLSLDHLLAKEIDECVGNLDYIAAKRPTILNNFAKTKSVGNLTKVMHSSMIDYGDSLPFRLVETLRKHWGYFALKGLYTSYIRINLPNLNQVRQLSVKDAYIYFNYALAKSLGITLTQIPIGYFRRVRNPAVIDATVLENLIQYPHTYQSDATWFITNQPTIPLFTSVDTFNGYAARLYETMIKEWLKVTEAQTYQRSSQLQSMVDQLYITEKIKLIDEDITFQAWLVDKNLDFDFSKSSWERLAKELFEASTGYIEDPTKNPKNIQKNLIELLKQLSSYSIQWLYDINQNPLMIAYWSAIRFGQKSQQDRCQIYLDSGMYLRLDQDQDTAFLKQDLDNLSLTALSSRDQNTFKNLHFTSQTFSIKGSSIHNRQQLNTSTMTYGLTSLN